MINHTKINMYRKWYQEGIVNLERLEELVTKEGVTKQEFINILTDLEEDLEQTLKEIVRDKDYLS